MASGPWYHSSTMGGNIIATNSSQVNRQWVSSVELGGMNMQQQTHSVKRGANESGSRPEMAEPIREASTCLDPPLSDVPQG